MGCTMLTEFNQALGSALSHVELYGDGSSKEML